MLTSADVITTLDNCHQNPYCNFITLGHPYSYLVDCRLNIFRGDDDRWAVAGEVLGYNPRGGIVDLEVFYFGNCLVNLETYNGMQTNSARFFPVDFDQFQETVDGEVIIDTATHWLVRGVPVTLSHNKQDYADAAIELKEYEPGEISAEEAARLAIINYGAYFRATDGELYKSIPGDLKKILVLDEWYHKDFYLQQSPFDSPTLSSRLDISDPFIQDMIKKQLEQKQETNRLEWESNRPGAYETWLQLAEVIAANDVALYKPAILPNTHWINWPESGSL